MVSAATGSNRWRSGIAGLLVGLLPTLCAAQKAPPVPITADTAVSHATQRTASGLRYLVHALGSGAVPVAGSQVTVRYTGFLPDGHAFDGTKPTGRPLRFRVGRHEVIPGWDEVLLLVPAGTKLRAWIPAALAYGDKGVLYPDSDYRYLIPPNTELIFEIELVSVR